MPKNSQFLRQFKNIVTSRKNYFYVIYMVNLGCTCLVTCVYMLGFTFNLYLKK